MRAFAYSLDGDKWVGGFESREDAGRAAVEDPAADYEPGRAAEVWTAECVYAPRAAALAPSGSTLLGIMESRLRDMDAPRAASDWMDKLHMLPEETLERLQHMVGNAIDQWAGNLGLQPRWFGVKGAHQLVRVLVPGKRAAEAG